MREMKTYCVKNETNRGKIIHIVNANSEKEAEEIGLSRGAWWCTASIIDTKTKGCVHIV